MSALRGQLRRGKLQGFPGGASARELAASAGNVRDAGSIPGSGSSPGGEHGNPLGFLSGKSHRQRSLAGYSPWGHKGRTQLKRLSACTHTHTHFRRITLNPRSSLTAHRQPQVDPGTPGLPASPPAPKAAQARGDNCCSEIKCCHTVKLKTLDKSAFRCLVRLRSRRH